MIRCLIIDDEPLSRQVLQSYAEDHPDLVVSGVCKDAMQAMKHLETEPVDLLLLDIHMPKLSGLSFYKSLQQKPQVVFTTAFSEHAVEGFELEATDYLLKPIAFDRFFQAIEKVKAKGQQGEGNSPKTHMMLKADKKTYRVLLKDILYCEALGDYVKVHLEEKTLIISSTMKNMMVELPYPEFLRVHKSYIVNTSKIEFLEGNQLGVAGHKITVGQSYRDSVREVLGT